MTNLNKAVFDLIPSLSEEAQTRIAHAVLRESLAATEAPEYNLTITGFRDKLATIKAIRTLFNLPLKEALDAVNDVLASGHHAFLGLSNKKANEAYSVFRDVAVTYKIEPASK